MRCRRRCRKRGPVAHPQLRCREEYRACNNAFGTHTLPRPYGDAGEGTSLHDLATRRMIYMMTHLQVPGATRSLIHGLAGSPNGSEPVSTCSTRLQHTQHGRRARRGHVRVRCTAGAHSPHSRTREGRSPRCHRARLRCCGWSEARMIEKPCPPPPPRQPPPPSPLCCTKAFSPRPSMTGEDRPVAGRLEGHCGLQSL